MRRSWGVPLCWIILSTDALVLFSLSSGAGGVQLCHRRALRQLACGWQCRTIGLCTRHAPGLSGAGSESVRRRVVEIGVSISSICGLALRYSAGQLGARGTRRVLRDVPTPHHSAREFLRGNRGGFSASGCGAVRSADVVLGQGGPKELRTTATSDLSSARSFSALGSGWRRWSRGEDWGGKEWRGGKKWKTGKKQEDQKTCCWCC
mmetsp:Transcript_25610/g.46651  ORF Transcript_25610/g.46651 Transcript_25610/m.46651 type:complete len:206 (-) Transcript_25610:680-1297(-)